MKTSNHKSMKSIHHKNTRQRLRDSMFPCSRERGFTLIESLVGVAIFMIIAVSVYQAYAITTNAVRASRIKIIATALANEQFEIIRNLPHSDVGVVGSTPNGKVPYTQNLVRDGTTFVVKTTIQNIDDPFDGTGGGSPNDTSPADYRLAELEISCPSCRNFLPLRFTTHVAPRALEVAPPPPASPVTLTDITPQSVPRGTPNIITVSGCDFETGFQYTVIYAGPGVNVSSGVTVVPDEEEDEQWCGHFTVTLSFVLPAGQYTLSVRTDQTGAVSNNMTFTITSP